MEDIYGLPDILIQQRIGGKVRSIRLKQNITQQDLSNLAGVSVSTLKKIESGHISSFGSLLRLMRVLGALDLLQDLIEEVKLSPNEYYELVNSIEKHQRKRARGSEKTEKGKSEW